MMKNIFSLAFLALGLVLNAQIGNVGIGTTAPTKTLHVSTTNQYILRQEDAVNTSNANYTIQSSDNFGTFQKVQTDVFRSLQLTTLPSTGATISQVNPSWQTTTMSITLPPGKWQITGALVLRPSVDLSGNSNTVLNCKLSVSDTSAGVIPSNDIVTGALTGSGYFYGSYYSPSEYQMMKGNIYVNNSSTATKTYYFIANIGRINNTTANFSNFGSSSELENQIFALPIF